MLVQVEGTAWASSLGEGVRKLVGDSGIRGLWRGNLLSVAKNIPDNGLFFLSYETFRELTAKQVRFFHHRHLSRHQNGKRKSQLSKAENFTCGSLAGAVGFITLYPFDVIRTRYAVARRGADGPLPTYSSHFYSSSHPRTRNGELAGSSREGHVGEARRARPLRRHDGRPTWHRPFLRNTSDCPAASVPSFGAHVS